MTTRAVCALSALIHLVLPADVFIAIREYDHSVKVRRHSMWIRLGIFSSFSAALWMFCVAVAMVLRRYKSKSKLFQRMRSYYRSVIECGIIVTAINLCNQMITRVHKGCCETTARSSYVDQLQMSSQ